MVDYDVIIVGGGPSGAVSARLTAEKGARVLLLDKASFPRDKPSRDLCLAGQTRAVIEELGLASRLESKPHAKVRGVRYTSPNGKSFSQRLPRVESGETHGWGIRSSTLDNILFEHASKACEFREKTHVVGLLKEGNRVVGVRIADLSTKETKEIRSRVVVGADGNNSVVAQQLNVNDIFPEHTLSCARGYYENVSGLTDEAEVHFLSNGVRAQLWITPLENNTCNVGLCVRLSDAQKNSIHPPTLLEKMLKQNTFASRFGESKLVGSVESWTHALSTSKRARAFPGALLVGSAAGLGESFSSDGLSSALFSGNLAAETITKALEKNDFSHEMMGEYEAALDLHLQNDISSAKQLHTLSTFASALDFTFAQAAQKPALREHLARAWIMNKLPAHETVSTAGFLKLLFA